MACKSLYKATVTSRVTHAALHHSNVQFFVLGNDMTDAINALMSGCLKIQSHELLTLEKVQDTVYF